MTHFEGHRQYHRARRLSGGEQRHHHRGRGSSSFAERHRDQLRFDHYGKMVCLDGQLLAPRAHQAGVRLGARARPRTGANHAHQGPRCLRQDRFAAGVERSRKPTGLLP